MKISTLILCLGRIFDNIVVQPGKLRYVISVYKLVYTFWVFIYVYHLLTLNKKCIV